MSNSNYPKGVCRVEKFLVIVHPFLHSRMANKIVATSMQGEPITLPSKRADLYGRLEFR